MKKIYILDESVSSKRNGIGTYLRQLTDCCKVENELCLIRFNADVKEFTMHVPSNGIRQMLFPAFPIGNFTQNGRTIRLFFKLYIPDSSDNVFIVNHSPCSKLLAAIKETLPLSKIVFVIHDLGWTFPLCGNEILYRKIIHQRNRKSIEKEYALLLERHDEEKMIYSLSDRVVCLSTDTYRLLREIYLVEEKKLVLIPNGLRDRRKKDNDVDALRRELCIEGDEQILFFVGRMTEHKGAFVLLEAFGRVLSACPKARLVMAGTCVGGDIEKVFTLLPYVATRVTLTGLLDKYRLYKWYSISQVGIISSCYEQCSYVGIEMMMHGLPIVATDSYGVRCMFQEGENAKVIPAKYGEKRDVLIDDLARAIIELLRQDELRSELAINSRRSYERWYSFGKMKKGYQGLLNDL